ncbi:MAG: aminopeptidase N [Halobacteriovorax sp.]|nr:aminopeptidase N [Halobacteriovorax sp.]|tara:strand:- start:11730 stop:14372 length:2643 start_codon:yes stop_codon:yes gene_type:complete
MKTETPQTIHLKDYKKPTYTITDIHLTFDLHDTQTKVKTKMSVESTGVEKGAPLVLNGEQLVFKKASIDGAQLEASRLELGDDLLTIKDVPEKFTLEIENEINPEANKALDGLYKSGSIFCTQNEPEGFRRITYYIDRPDVMAKFTTKVIADKKLYPVLLSNGNPLERGDLDGGKHFVVWEDPFPKPSYLYALVAGDLGLVKDTYKTMSGREIALEIFCDKGNEDKCGHAMESLKKSMKWDEDTYGLEYDLDIYMIVAVDSFNMGAMENKGLNIFNSAYVLAKPETATDDNFLGIEGVVGHEYFHNWTGNRITCRDWFQLTLKEGLTVYRDQEFSSDMNSAAVKRIQDVDILRNHQFREDAGPTAHPIKPPSYIEINNFYTSTVYDKGAEVIRMIETFLGKEGFRRGMDKYFELYDGRAVTTEDFIHAMSIANSNYDFEQFKLWYAQAGTPQIDVKWNYDASEKVYTLTVIQSCPPTPEHDEKRPFHFPLRVALLGKTGNELPLNLVDKKGQPQIEEGILHMRSETETYIFTGVEEEPTLSINRGFSAPLKVYTPYKESDLIFLLGNDTDQFNRYEAAQLMGQRLVYHNLKEKHDGKELTLDADYIEAWGKVLGDESLDGLIKSEILSLPSESILQQGHSPIDYKGLHEVRRWMKGELAKAHRELLQKTYDGLNIEKPYKLDPKSMGERSLKNVCLSFLAVLDDEAAHELCYSQFSKATNMTEEIAALSFLINCNTDLSKKAVNEFYEKWKHETLVMQKWLGVQASCRFDSTLDRVLELENDSVYDKTVPNLLRSLLGGFARNAVQFHREDGAGYKFLAKKILEIDKINPQMASGLAGIFRDYKRLNESAKGKMKVELEALKETEGLSKNTYEIVSKILH